MPDEDDIASDIDEAPLDEPEGDDGDDSDHAADYPDLTPPDDGD